MVVMERTREGLGEAIRKSVADVVDARSSNAGFLANSREFDHFLKLSKEARVISDKLFVELTRGQKLYKLEQKKNDLDILLANLIKEHAINGQVVQNPHKVIKVIAFSSNRNHYSYTRYWFIKCSAFTIDLKNGLEKKRMAEFKKWFNYPNKSRSYLGRLWPTRKLLELFGNQPVVIKKYPPLIQIKGDDDKFIDFKKTDKVKIHRIEKILKMVNKVNAEAEIELVQKNGEMLKLNTALHTVFRNKTTLGGRLYTSGHNHYQQFSGEERARITINGDDVVELDYSALHPRLLYAKEGIQYGKDNDPYADVNPVLVFRPWLKIILLSLLNSKTRNIARGAAWEWLNPDYANKLFTSLSHKQKKRVSKISRIKNEGYYDATPFIGAFYEKHKPINKYFCKGKETGRRLQNQDGQIALQIVNHFGKQGIPILAIHDSFVVQRQHKDELNTVMQRQYTRHTGGFKCPIK